MAGVGVADYEITLIENLSQELKESLPTIEDFETEFIKKIFNKNNK
jgi:hypothetical protein